MIRNLLIAALLAAWATPAAAVDLSKQTPIEVDVRLGTVDEDLSRSVGIVREGFVVHVFQGRETDVLSDGGFGENGNEH